MEDVFEGVGESTKGKAGVKGGEFRIREWHFEVGVREVKGGRLSVVGVSYCSQVAVLRYQYIGHYLHVRLIQERVAHQHDALEPVPIQQRPKLALGNP